MSSTTKIIIYAKTINTPRTNFVIGKYRRFRQGARNLVFSSSEAELRWNINHIYILVASDCPQVNCFLNPNHFLKSGFFVDIYPHGCQRPIYRADFGPNRAYQSSFTLKIYLQAVGPLITTDIPTCMTINKKTCQQVKNTGKP